jgi:hypothetical protein
MTRLFTPEEIEQVSTEQREAGNIMDVTRREISLVLRRNEP